MYELDIKLLKEEQINAAFINHICFSSKRFLLFSISKDITLNLPHNAVTETKLCRVVVTLDVYQSHIGEMSDQLPET